MRMMLFFFSALILSATSALALPPTPGDTGSSAPAADSQQIAQDIDAGSDRRIAERIRTIFAELPAFQSITAEVNDGVVMLTGTVADEADIARAENIAGRITGVVTVESDIERDVSVEGGLDALSDLSDRMTGWLELLPLAGLALLVAMVISAFGYLLASLRSFWRRVTPNVFLAELVATALRSLFIVLGLVVALDMLGAGALLGAVLGGAGVVGIALGFAMRDTIENYVASLMLSLRQPFRANDHVLIDDKEGRVIRLTSRATVLMTLDGNHLRIPNAQVFKAVILNYTTNPQRRFEFDLGIDADDDPRAAMRLGRETLAGLGFILGTPEPAARVQMVGDSNIVIRFLGWVDQREADWHKSRSRAISAVKEALEDTGFALPEPIYRLRFDGRTDPLPIGRSANVTESDAEQPKARKMTAAESPAEVDDVKPESEIAQMVDQERSEEREQSEDLLDPTRPTE